MKVKLSALLMSTMLLGSMFVMPAQVGMADTQQATESFVSATQSDFKDQAVSEISSNPSINVTAMYDAPIKSEAFGVLMNTNPLPVIFHIYAYDDLNGKNPTYVGDFQVSTSEFHNGVTTIEIPENIRSTLDSNRFYNFKTIPTNVYAYQQSHDTYVFSTVGQVVINESGPSDEDTMNFVSSLGQYNWNNIGILTDIDGNDVSNLLPWENDLLAYPLYDESGNPIQAKYTFSSTALIDGVSTDITNMFIPATTVLWADNNFVNVSLLHTYRHDWTGINPITPEVDALPEKPVDDDWTGKTPITPEVDPQPSIQPDDNWTDKQPITPEVDPLPQKPTDDDWTSKNPVTPTVDPVVKLSDNTEHNDTTTNQTVNINSNQTTNESLPQVLTNNKTSHVELPDTSAQKKLSLAAIVSSIALISGLVLLAAKFKK